MDPNGSVRVQQGAPACRNHPHNNGSVVARARVTPIRSEPVPTRAFARSFFFIPFLLASIAMALREEEAGRKGVKA